MPAGGPAIRCSWGGEEVLAHVARLFGAEALKPLEGLRVLTCSDSFTEAYALTPEVAEAVQALMAAGRVPFSAGLYLGRVRRSRPYFIPSHNLVQEIYRALGRPVRAYTIGEHGLRPYLYGRDALAASLKQCHPPIEAGEVVAIIDEEGWVYGIGLSTKNSCEEAQKAKPNEAIAKNIFDIGWYIRSQTRKERKYKIT